MICGQCGKENDAGNKFCIYCGAVMGGDVVAPGRRNVKKQIFARREAKGTEIGKRKVFIASLAVGLVLIAGIGGIVYFTGDTYSCKRAMSLAEKCYEEKKFQDALYYYEDALELDDTLAEAYLKSADIYVDEEKYEDALKRLREGIEKTGDENLYQILTKVYLELADRNISDEKYEEALGKVKEGISIRENEDLLAKRSELYLLLADLYAEDGNEEEELQILDEAINVTGEVVFIERRDLIFQRQMETQMAKTAEEKGDEQENDFGSLVAGIYRREDTSWEETEEEHFDVSEEETTLAKLDSSGSSEEPVPNGYSIADFAGKETKIYEWDGVERKVRDNVRGKQFVDYRDAYSAGHGISSSNYSPLNRASKMDEDCEQLFMYILVELMNELGVAGTDTFHVAKCEDMNGYLVTDANIYKVQPVMWRGGTPPVVYIRIESSTVAYSYPSDVTPN